MNEVEFNLLVEPWIVVIKEDGITEEMSIKEVFCQAHNIKSLAGEVPAQDVAILRILLAILYAVYYRAELNSNASNLEDEEDAIEIWVKMWKKNKFNIEQLEDYLLTYYERFWLFHSKYPFYQVLIENGTSYDSPKLIGELSESGNKPRLFSNRNGLAKNKISYNEAARWLIHLNAFDDTSSKPSVRKGGLPSPGAGWLGKLGLIYPEGRNLFETLMLNFTMTDYNGDIFPDGKAIWEVEPSAEERVEIPTPESPIEILTLQSRRILLERLDACVVGYLLLGGDIVLKENALIEQMTVWRKNKEEQWTPKRHDPSRLMWRDFSAIISKSEGTQKPGVVRWTSMLVRKGIFPYDHANFRISGVKYGSKDFFAEDFIDDNMEFSSKLLGETGEVWNERITDSIERTDNCVKIFGNYAKNLSTLSGNDPKGSNVEHARESAKGLAYYALDSSFRSWLSSIDPDKDDEEKKLGEWMQKMYDILVNDLGKKLLNESGVKALVGGDMNKNSISSFIFFRNSVRKVMRGE